MSASPPHIRNGPQRRLATYGSSCARVRLNAIPQETSARHPQISFAFQSPYCSLDMCNPNCKDGADVSNRTSKVRINRVSPSSKTRDQRVGEGLRRGTIPVSESFLDDSNSTEERWRVCTSSAISATCVARPLLSGIPSCQILSMERDFPPGSPFSRSDRIASLTPPTSIPQPAPSLEEHSVSSI